MRGMDKKLKLLTYGCQMNVADSERMAGHLKQIGYSLTEDLAAADLILINTCCVRGTAEDKVLGQIGRFKTLKREKPSLILGVAGCMAQKEGANLIKRAPHVDFVLGTGQSCEVARVVQSIERERKHIVDTSNVSGSIPTEVFPLRGGQVSTFVPIMYGCNNFCTYCIVPYVRGRERSRQPEEIFAEVKQAVAEGFKEITLLGQNVNSYSGGMTFAELLTAVDKIAGVERLRFMTSHPKDLSDELIASIAGGKNICEHIHLPVQYGSDKILKRMNRVYTVEKYLRLVEKIRAAIPAVSLTTDLIVGFPGETEEDFAETLDFLRAVQFDAAFTFIYSKRSGTPAATFDNQIDEQTKHRRLDALMNVQNAISLEKNRALLDSTVEILVEGASKTDDKIFTGRTRSNKLVLFAHENERAGDLINVKITQAQTWLLKGNTSGENSGFVAP
ncbi:MAG: tRNA (N6-isopentenyl adenosine(37)-C2)-methylthiotransferase MiaB [Selenomonadaceae bacterium]|nr:tRNA (N6-isopentenyl adenosine(37)-C2)-methylthiotransferase MiaB [Selenomonadaceae bacterium]